MDKIHLTNKTELLKDIGTWLDGLEHDTQFVVDRGPTYYLIEM